MLRESKSLNHYSNETIFRNEPIADVIGDGLR
jgi:hypothetical protein